MGDLSPMTDNDVQEIVHLFNTILHAYKGTIQFVDDVASTMIRGVYRYNKNSKDTISITIEKEVEPR